MNKFVKVFLVGVLAHLPSAVAIHFREVRTPSQQTSTASATCSNPTTRSEWSSVSQDVLDAYVAAVNCLTTKPSRIGLSTTLYDDFAWVHNSLNHEIHFVASFLPWHRYWIHIYERTLQDCGYTGSLLYWDWSLDSASPSTAKIWDPNTGIGGNGSRDNSTNPEFIPVIDGPFKNLTPAYFGSEYLPHPLSREFNNGTDQVGDMFGQYYTPEVLATIRTLDTYDQFHKELEGGAHAAVHSAIGGDMLPVTSPNDPIFFIHHTQIDRLWAQWQNDNATVRTDAYGGIRTQQIKGGSTPAQAQLTDVLKMLGMAEDITVQDVMDIQGGLLCYKY